MMFYNHRALVVALTKAMYSNFMEKWAICFSFTLEITLLASIKQ
jgi:hypothetical protein